MIVRRAGAAALADLQDVPPGTLAAFAGWVAGVGAALMAAVLSQVTVHSGRRAVGFHLRNGFRRQLLLREPAAR